MNKIIMELIGPFLPYIIATAGGAVALAVAFFKGRAAGVAKMENKQLKADIKAHQDRERIEDEVSGDSDDAVRDRLRNDARR